jgi:hypothetical protein
MDDSCEAGREQLDIDAKLVSVSVGLQRALNDIGDVLRSKPKIAQGDFADAVDRAVRGLIVATTDGWAIPTDKVRFVARKGRAWLEGDSGAPIALIEAIGNAIKLGHFIDGIEQEGDA